MRKNYRGGDELLLKNGTLDWLRLLTMLFPHKIYMARGPRYFGGFCNISQPNIGEVQKKSYHLARVPGTVQRGKSGPGYFITFIKRLDEGLR